MAGGERVKPITAVVLGAGSRGETYAGYACAYPEQLQNQSFLRFG